LPTCDWIIMLQVATGVANGATRQRGNAVHNLLPRTRRRTAGWTVARQVASGAAGGANAGGGLSDTLPRRHRRTLWRIATQLAVGVANSFARLAIGVDISDMQRME
jgi:hypothetical protein